MSVEKISPEQEIQTQESVSDDRTSTEEKKLQVDTQNESIAKQAEVDAQSIIDKANQELAKIPQKIEDNLDVLIKTLKILMGKNVDPRVDINSPDFDIDVAIGDFNKILNPLLGVVSPIESVVGKIPLIGDIMGLLTKLTYGGDTGGLSMEDIKKLVPSMPEIPPSLKSKVYETQVTIQEFCKQLPMLLIKVIFSMLVAIYDMFDQIVGIIGVPPAIFPFNLVKQLPNIVDKAIDFSTNAPSQIKTIVEGKIKDMMAASQALAIPNPPTQIPTGIKKEDKKEESSPKQATNKTEPPPEPSQPAPTESTIVEVPKIEPKPPIQEPKAF